MAKGIKLNELKQGNIIKVLFGNGDVIKGCYFGKQFVRHGLRGSSVEGGNFLVVMDHVSKKPYVVNINAYKSDNRTTIKEVTGTRFDKDVSQYLKKYVRALAKQQEVSLGELEMIRKRKAEDKKLEALEQAGEKLNYRVDVDSLPLEDRVRIVFKDFSELAKEKSAHERRINQADYPNFRQEWKVNTLRFLVTHRAGLNVADSDIGVFPDFEYDGTYAPDVDKTVDLNAVASKYLRVTETDTKTLLNTLNKLNGIKVKDNALYRMSTGGYANDGSIAFEPTLILDRDVSEAVLKKAKTLIIDYVKKG